MNTPEQLNVSTFIVFVYICTMEKSTVIKTPNTEHGVSAMITRRWSARSFSDKEIAGAMMSRLFEAASWTASSMNEQPWQYLYAHRGTEAFDRMIDCLMGGNQPWAKTAAVLVISLARRNFERNGQANRHHMHDTGAANTTLLLEAAQNDIYGHMIGGFHQGQALEKFDINSQEMEIACFIALGYLGSPEQLEEPFRTRELTSRTRKSVPDFTEKL